MSDSVQVSPVSLAREPSFTLGRLEIRPASREAIAPEFRETLEPRVMQVLVALAKSRGEVVSRDELALTCWDGRVVGEDAINRVISRLRRLSEHDEGRSFTLETITKVGYRLVEIAHGGQAAPSGETPASPPAELPPGPAPAASPAGRRRLWIWMVLALVVLGGAAAIEMLVWHPWRYDSNERQDRPNGNRPRIAGAARDDFMSARKALDGGGTAEEIARSVALLEDVVRRAPDWAEAWGLLSLAYLSTAQYTPPEAQDAVQANARDAANHALQLDPREAQARFVLAAMKTFVGHWAEARQAFEDMLKENPQSRLFVSLLASFDTSAGLLNEALDLYRRLPMNDRSRNARGEAAYATLLANIGNVADAANVLDNAAREWPRNTSVYFTRFWFSLFTGHPEKSLAAIEDTASRPIGIDPQDFDLYREAALAFVTRKPEDINAALQNNADAGGRGRGYAQNAMRMAASLGNLDLAFALADRIYFDRGEPLGKLMFSGAQGQYVIGGSRPVFLLFDLSTANMRRDLRFVAIAEELGLADYWRQSGNWPDFCLDDPAAAEVCAKIKAGPN